MAYYIEYNSAKGTAKEVYESLVNERSAPLLRAQKCSQITLPWVLPDLYNNKTGWKSFPSPWNADSARGIMTLASKFISGLFPQNTAFFYLEPDPTAQYFIEDEFGIVHKVRINGKVEQQMREALMKGARKILMEMNRRSALPVMEEAEINALVTGGALLKFPPKQRPRNYTMDTFVLDRDSYGTITNIVTCNKISRVSMGPALRAAADRKKIMATTGANTDTSAKEYELLNYVQMVEGDDDDLSTQEYEEWQEVEGVRVDGSMTTYPKGKALRWIYLPWRRVAGEVYGRSRVEELYGVHAQYEAFTQILMESAAISSRRVKLVKRGGMTDIDELASAPNGAYVLGDREDLGEGDSVNPADLNFVAGVHEALRQTIYKCYGVYDPKPVERRTAEEATMLNEDLNASNGGVYSQQVETLQIPVVRIFLEELIESGELNFGLQSTAKEVIQPRIISGFEALSRNQEATKWGQFLQMVGLAHQSGIIPYSNKRTLYSTFATSLGLDVTDKLLSEDEIAAIDQQAQQQTAQESLSSEAAKAMREIAVKRVPENIPANSGAPV